MIKEKKLSEYLIKAKNLDESNYVKKVKIAILSSFTINGILEVLKVKLAKKSVHAQTYLGGYNQYNQEILDRESQLYKFLPNITFLILDIRDILPEFYYSAHFISPGFICFC